MSWRALLFAGGLAIVTGCSFGLAPVVQAARSRLEGALDSGSRGSGSTVAAPLRAALTVAQVACAVLLLIAAGLLVRSLWALSRSDPGFHADQVVTARIAPAESICGTAERCLTFYRELERQVQAAPGVRGAALVNTLPLDRRGRQALGRAGGLRRAGGKDGAAVLDACRDAGLLQGDGHPARERPSVHASRSRREASRGDRHERHRQTLLA